jgi:hypothetical protein
MDIEQAKQHMADFTSNAIRGGLNVYDVLNFSMDFLDLMHERKMSPGNEALFANITALFIWSGDYLKTVETYLNIVEQYLERMHPNE